MEELNNGLQDACNKVKDSCMATDSEYEIALNEYSSKATKAKAKSATASPYQTSLSLYSAGMLLVKAAGCTHTAESMNHAIVPESNVGTGWTPSNYDFDWNEYDNFAVDFGNNYCKVMQDNGYIAPFNIYIVGDM